MKNHDFSSSTLQELTDEQIITIYKEFLEYEKTGQLINSLFKDTVMHLSNTSFNRGQNSINIEINRVELFISIKLARKYITEHHL